MANYDLIPSKYVWEQSTKKECTPIEYIQNSTVRMSEDLRDKRLMDKNGINLLQDIMITRTDGTKVIIHEMVSDSNNYQMIEVSKVDENNNWLPGIIVYTHGLDFGKMQTDSDYLNILGDSLLSEERLVEKEEMAKQHDSLDIIYIGTIGKNEITGQYEKRAMDYEIVVNSIKQERQESSRQLQEKHEKERADREKQLQESIMKKEKYITSIISELNKLSLEEIQQIAEAMGIVIAENKNDIYHRMARYRMAHSTNNSRNGIVHTITGGHSQEDERAL